MIDFIPASTWRRDRSKYKLTLENPPYSQNICLTYDPLTILFVSSLKKTFSEKVNRLKWKVLLPPSLIKSALMGSHGYRNLQCTPNRLVHIHCRQIGLWKPAFESCIWAVESSLEGSYVNNKHIKQLQSILWKYATQKLTNGVISIGKLITYLHLHKEV